MGLEGVWLVEFAIEAIANRYIPAACDRDATL